MEPEAFAETARGFAEYILDASQLTLEERLEAGAAVLAQLYLAGRLLPEASPVEMPLTGSPDFDDWPGFGALESYYAIENPLEPPDVVDELQLSVDVITVFDCVWRGLILFEEGQTDEAMAWWRISFDGEWGARACRALQILHHGSDRFRSERTRRQRPRRTVAFEETVWRDDQPSSMALLAGGPKNEPAAPTSSERGAVGLRFEPAVVGHAIVAVHPRGPAAGILEPGDLLLTVSGTSVDGLAEADVGSLLAQPVGSSVHIEIYRDGQAFSLSIVPVAPASLRAGPPKEGPSPD